MVLGFWALTAVVLMAIALPGMERPGLYYDEAFLAQQARDFTEPDRVGSHAPTATSVWLLGRPYPLRNAAYLGSLKSQLTIPSLWLFGASPTVLRATTLAWGLIGLLLTMLWAQRSFDAPTAVATGILIATDPAFYFFSQMEWGPFTIGLVCRSGGFLLLVLGWRKRSALLHFGGGLVLGLGVYSRVDFVVILAAAGVALAVCHPGVARQALGPRRGAAGWTLAGFALTATTMLLSARQILATGQSIAERGGLEYKARVLWSTLDGSHFYALMDVGGLFDDMFEVESPSGIFGYAVVACAILLGGAAVQGWRRRDTADARPFLLLTTALLAAFMLATPGAVRAHHMLNLMPFAHLLVGTTLAAAWRPGAGSDRTRARVVAGLAITAIAGANVTVTAQTRALIDETGGRGRWTDALLAFAREIDTDPDAVVVSLDWGLHEPLQFTTSRARPVELIWVLPHALRSGRAFAHEGDATHTYLVHPPPWDLFRLSAPFLEAVDRLGPDRAEVTRHRDRAGGHAFTSVRIPWPHRIVYDGRFRIERR